MDGIDLLKQLYKQYGDKLVEEVAAVVSENGQGDCYGCLCSKYCLGTTCQKAIETVVKELLEDK